MAIIKKQQKQLHHAKEELSYWIPPEPVFEICVELGLNKRMIETTEEFKVFLVNGEYVRNNLEIDFTMGSNPHVSSFIPKGEVWLDDRLSKNDIMALIIHEIHEARLMREGLDYPTAHAQATELEKKFRKENFL